MDQISLYRVLLTGIPLSLSPERFYDYLRSFVGDEGVYNALLVTGISDEQEPNRTKKRNVGAALVDFVSKGVAESAMSSPFRIGSTIVQWKSLGRVQVTLARLNDSGGPEQDNMTSSVTGKGRHMYASHRHHASHSRQSTSSRRESPKLHVTVKDYSRSVYLTRKEEKGDGCPLDPCQLFSSLQSFLRRKGLGYIISMNVLSPSDVIIHTDADTAQSLVEDQRLHLPYSPEGEHSRYHLTWTAHSRCKSSINIHAVRDHPAGSNGGVTAHHNFTHVPLEGLLVAMGRVHSVTRGTCASFRDPYGNIIFPHYSQHNR